LGIELDHSSAGRDDPPERRESHADRAVPDAP
jgi:hypothetical protein